MVWLVFWSCSVDIESKHTVFTPGDTATVDVGPPFGYPYLLTFHSCNVAQSNCGDPSTHLVYLAGSTDGLEWDIIPEMNPFPSSVPDVVIRDDVLYVMGLPQLQRMDLKTGIWMETVYPQIFDGTEFIMHVDPSMYVDEQNRIVLFFMEGIEGSDPATCPPGETVCTKYFLSATEVPGSMGTLFSLDEGIRMSIELNETQRIAADPDIFAGPDGFYQYVSRGQNTQVFYSDNLRGAYSPVATLNDAILSMGGGGVPAGYFDLQDFVYWTFVTTNVDGGYTDIRLAQHSTLLEQLRYDDFDTILSGPEHLTNDHLVSSPGFFAFVEAE